MTGVLAYIFMDILPSPARARDPLEMFTKKKKQSFEQFIFAAGVVATGIVLHELAHKFVAIALGQDAVFHASYKFLALGVLLKLIHFPVLFFVPGYVSIIGASSPFEHAITAFAGPFMHLLLFGIAWLMLSQKALTPKKPEMRMFLALTKRINLWLFILNMLPIPGFDGFGVFSSIFAMI